MKVKNDYRSKFSNLSNWKEEAWKNQGFHVFESRYRGGHGSNPVEALIFSGFLFPIA